mmetsp:Transcript_36897/g.67507  ORF Transcript_36897/g.67507 Transcript_36897/m.67507 type:complete len:203 (-) Transcript_36897:78-686(-)
MDQNPAASATQPLSHGGRVKPARWYRKEEGAPASSSSMFGQTGAPLPHFSVQRRQFLPGGFASWEALENGEAQAPILPRARAAFTSPSFGIDPNPNGGVSGNEGVDEASLTAAELMAGGWSCGSEKLAEMRADTSHFAVSVWKRPEAAERREPEERRGAGSGGGGTSDKEAKKKKPWWERQRIEARPDPPYRHEHEAHFKAF